MKHRRDLALSFLLAIALHAGAGLALTAVLPDRRSAEPVFDTGLSSVELTLVAAPPNSPTPLREDATEVETDEAVAMAPIVPAEDVADPADLSDPPAPPVPVESLAVAPTQPVLRPDRDADALDKGVASRFIIQGPVRPRYPIGSRYRGEEGTVVVEVQVGAGGRALSAEVRTTSGHGALDRAALAAASRARFRVTGAGVPRKRAVALTFRFELTAAGNEGVVD